MPSTLSQGIVLTLQPDSCTLHGEEDEMTLLARCALIEAAAMRLKGMDDTAIRRYFDKQLDEGGITVDTYVAVLDYLTP